MSPTTIPVHAPWAYESLPSQKAVEDSFIFQIMQSVVFIILSSVKDYEFVVYRRFNYVTCIYITNRLAATICIVGYWTLNYATTVDCNAVNRVTATAEGLCQFTSSALLSLRIWVLYRKQIYVPIFMTLFMIPGPIINIVAWTPLQIGTLPSPGGCQFTSRPPRWVDIPFIMQSIFDLLIFVLCVVELLWKSDLSIRHLGNQPVGLALRIRREFLNGGVCQIPFP
ncbi:hypothetical protein V8E51_015435 [Hyaloscypha variabilis]